MPSDVPQDVSRVDETTSQHPESIDSVSRSERSQDTQGRRQGTHIGGLGQLASLANTTLPSSSSSASLANHQTQNSTPTAYSNFVPEGQANRPLLSPPLSPRAVSTPLSSRTGYFAHQPGASGLEPRSPPTRRPPASRSSHGIETSSGPPPALSTQRSYPAESSWKQPPLTDSIVTRPSASRTQTTDSIDSVVRLSQNKTDKWTSLDHITAGNQESRTPGAADTKMLYNKRSTTEDDQDRTLRTIEGIGRTPPKSTYGRRGQEEEQLQSPHEDLFLNLAHTDAGIATEPLSRSERRRSQASLLSPRKTNPTRPSTNGRPSSSGNSFAEQDGTSARDHRSRHWLQPGYAPHTDSPTAPAKNSLPKDRSYAASAHPLDQGPRYRYTELNPKTTFSTNRTRDQSNREPSPELPVPYGRRQSTPEVSPAIPPWSYKPSTNGQHKPSPHHGRSSQIAEQNSVVQTPRAEGTESTVSTTAPSTVWDELDDMKSRIRKLELTGKIPQSSGAAIAGVIGERPRTATTTVTTVSSSPKQRRDKTVSPEASTVRGRGVDNIHPLLHSALARSKPLLSPNMYRVLEATATDALTLAAMAGGTGGRSAGTDSPASAVGPANAVDRQLRRKADSMCRSLTELCIALADDMAEAGPPSTKVRPGGRGATTTEQRGSTASEEPRFVRASTQEPEARSSSRIMSRLEARRSSLQALASVTRRESSPIDAVSPSQTATPPVASRLDRSSSALLDRRSNEDEEQTPPGALTRLDRTSSILLRPSHVREDSPNAHVPARSASRTRTESSYLPPKRTSREYTSQHPLPGPTPSTQRSPSIHSALPSRRTYFQPSAPAPVTPNVQPGNRRYLEQRSTPPSGESPRLAEARERRRALFEQHAGTRMEGSDVGASRYRRG